MKETDPNSRSTILNDFLLLVNSMLHQDDLFNSEIHQRLKRNPVVTKAGGDWGPDFSSEFTLLTNNSSSSTVS